MDKITERLASYADDLEYEKLPQEAIHAVKKSVVDSIGCALGAFEETPIRALRDIAVEETAVHPATVIGTDISSTPELCALTNGSMIRYLDFSDDYFGPTADWQAMGPHPSDNIGGLMAAAEAHHLDGAALILGILLAYEACGSLADQIELRQHGWDHPILHSIGTALGVAKIWGLSRDQIGNAVSLAIVPNIPLIETRMGHIANWKGLAGPNGSRSGLFAATLAKAGILGPPPPFEGGAGLMKQLNCPFELGPLGGDGQPFKVEQTYFKNLPCSYRNQLPTSVALALHDELDLSEVEKIRIFVERFTYSISQKPEAWAPQSRETADHSMPYMVGAVLTDGELSAHTFSEERYRDPALIEFISKLSVEEDEEYTKLHPQMFNCRFEITLKSGEVLVRHGKNPKGHPDNPMSDEELSAKFRRQVGSRLSDKQSALLLEQLWDLENIGDVAELFPLMLVQQA